MTNQEKEQIPLLELSVECKINVKEQYPEFDI